MVHYSLNKSAKRNVESTLCAEECKDSLRAGENMAKNRKNLVGRPTVVTPEVVAKLEYGFMRGMNDTEACLYADISRSAFYDYCNKNPEFTDRKEELKKQPSVKAKLNVTEAIEQGDVDLSKWYLERRNKDEFSLKQEIKADVTEEVTINLELVDE